MIDELGTRMKENYEHRFRFLLPRRSNIMIRLDGKAFHSYTKGLKRPFDEGLAEDMDATAKYLAENIQGAKLAYVQSDEISIWITDYDDVKTDAWFDYNIQKMSSISASMATAKFNQLRMKRACYDGLDVDGCLYADDLNKFKLAMFDSRVFILPDIGEVANYLLWRQKDATRNSISMAAQSVYSHKELHGVNSEGKQELLFKKGINWNDYTVRFKRGGTFIKVTENYTKKKGEKSKGVLVEPGKLLEVIQALGILGDQTQHELYSRTSWKSIETPMPNKIYEMIESIKNSLDKEE